MLPTEYLTRTFWDRPERKPRGDGRDSTIYRAVGAALSQWEQLESTISDIFAALVESKSQAASRAYGNIASSVGRIQALDCAAEIFFETHQNIDRSAYISMVKVVGSAAPRRNDFAHGTVKIYAAKNVIGGGHYLVAPDYNTRRTDAFISFPVGDKEGEDPFSWAPSNYAFTAAQITVFTKRFARLEREALNLARSLSRS